MNMQKPGFASTHRHLPHWTLNGSVYFFTFRLAAGELSLAERQIVLDHVKAGHGRFYNLAAATVMPDHVHLILRPNDEFTPSQIMKGIKGTSARLLNQHRNTTGSIWQDESWDRIIRNAEEYSEKLEYMYENPIKTGLVPPDATYNAWYFNPDFA